MLEASKNEYFIDGFLIRHFNIFPSSFDKENLFYEQRLFLIYLMGNIPSLDTWHREMSYRNKMEEINNMQVKDIFLTDEEMSLAKLYGDDTNAIKIRKLSSEKQLRIKKLKKEFGLVEEDGSDSSAEVSEVKKEEFDPQQLWEKLQGRGLG